ncbi:MAG: hypothetical protein CMO55_23920 [Verrucomicrobiales bacterium]|nr:hypothetical protein [Verrucomicrobiales bacterium]
MRRLFSLLLLAVASTLSAADESPKPNVLLIMADDLGYSDLGCYGGEIATPNLDSIAENGLRYTQMYNTARCWPTRSSLLTGFYAQQIRRDTLPNVPSGGGNTGKRPEWAQLLPKLLKPQGYRSYHTGKWHIDGMPVAEGFDHSYLLKDQSRFFNPTKHYKDDEELPPVEKDSGYYGTIAVADHALEVLKDHAANHSDEPFFHYVAFAAPHFPLHALPEDIAKYDGKYDEGWDVIRSKRFRRQKEMGVLDSAGVTELSRVERDLGPPYHFDDAFEILGPGEVNKPVPWKSLNDEQKKFQADKMEIHAAMIDRMDIEIGRIFDQIKSMGEWENTLVIFLSDNGASAEIMVRADGHDPSAPMGSAETYLCLGPGWSTSSNTPFRRHKTWTHEGGTSTPFLVSWPKGIEAKGDFRSNPGHVVDVVPTILQLAGTCFPEEAPPSPGRSLVPTFTEDNSVDHEFLWWFHDGHKAIRMGDWKAVAPKGESWELYNVAEDRDESTDLAIVNPEQLEYLASRWEQQLKDTIELATRDLSEEALEKAKGKTGRPSKMLEAQDAAKSKGQVLINGESFFLKGRKAFVMKSEFPAEGKPWIFYGPTLPKYPDKNESWMYEQFLKAGIAVAGIDVGEAYGSPKAFPYFDALYEEMVSRGYSETPALLGRSRGGLWVSSWAIEHPERVAGIGGIYPVFDFTTYPKTKNAAPVYGLSEEELLAKEDELNPIKKADVLAKAEIPVFIIHGKDDKVVPLADNSEALEAIYRVNDAYDVFHIIKVDEQGHNLWEGFFHCQELVDFLIDRAKAGAEK